MTRGVLTIVLFFFTLLGSASAQNCGAYPNTLANGTNADANQVMANFNAVRNCVNNLPPPPINALADVDRQNILLESIYQSKLFGGYRRQINRFSDGYKASDGINAGASLNYSLDTSGGKVSPSVTTSTTTIQSQTTTSSNATATTLVDLVTALTNDASVTAVGFSSPNAISGVKVKIVKRNSAGNFDVVADTGSVSHPGGGFVDFALSYTVPSTGSYYLAMLSPNTGGIIIGFGANASRAFKSGDQTGTGITGWTEDTGPTVPLRYSFVVGVNNLTLVTTSQTADASVSSGRVLIEFDNTANPTINTDLTAEVTCNGGTNWTAATLSSVSTNGQGGRKVVETADTACTGGTSFASRVKTFNSKNVLIYGTSLTVH